VRQGADKIAQLAAGCERYGGMVQPLQPRSFQGFNDFPPAPAVSGAPAQPQHVRDVSEIPDARSFGGTPGAHSPDAPSSTGALGVAGRASGNLAAIQNRLDAFRATATPLFHTPEGDVQVSTPFRVPPGYASHEASTVRPNDATVRAVAKTIGMPDSEVTLVKQGRGTPGEVQRLTQGLIDSGRLPPATANSTLAGRVRQMMFDHGIGMDCAGYVHQAAVAAHPNARVGWRAAVNEDLSGLSTRGMVRVPIGAAQAGDIIVLDAPAGTYGHTVVVYDARTATPTDRHWLNAEARDEAAIAPFAASPFLRVFELDSSWGCDNQASKGGVQRVTWVEDQTTGRWLSIDSAREYRVTDTPYGHAVGGVYRPAVER
jgi:hypothetical protein